MKKIRDYLSPSQIKEAESLPVPEKFAATLRFIEFKDPDARFTTRDISQFLGVKPHGLHSMAKAIRKVYPDFPVEMILKGYRYPKTSVYSFNKKRVDDLNESWKKK